MLIVPLPAVFSPIRGLVPSPSSAPPSLFDVVSFLGLIVEGLFYES